jgi:hypothetical protein
MTESGRKGAHGPLGAIAIGSFGPRLREDHANAVARDGERQGTYGLAGDSGGGMRCAGDGVAGINVMVVMDSKSPSNPLICA